MGNAATHSFTFPSTTNHLQAWIEASTKGAVLLFTASEVETATSNLVGPGAAGLLGGMCGGIAQAYATMGTLSQISTKR